MPKSSDEVKQTIRNTYRAIAQSLPGFKPRREQNFLAATIAQVLLGEKNDSHLLVAEAGTGIGKSLAYAQSAIPTAQALQKTLVISTATVALQEQLIHKDLPYLRDYGQLPFSFLLVKGRSRYCCAERLQLAVKNNATNTTQLDFGFLGTSVLTAAELSTLEALHQAYMAGQWDGDRDAWPTALSDALWQHIHADPAVCQSGFSQHATCPFHRARERLSHYDVLVVNHALLLSDLSMGGGVLLPPPEDCLHVLDEAHHLAVIARDSGAAAIQLGTEKRWLDRLNQTIATHMAAYDIDLTQLHAAIADILLGLKELYLWADHNPDYFQAEHHRFEKGVLPTTLLLLSQSLNQASAALGQSLDACVQLIQERLKTSSPADNATVEPVLAEVAFYQQRCRRLAQLWHYFSQEVAPEQPPLALWVSLIATPHLDFAWHASPVDVGHLLDSWLWSKTQGAVLTSATLTALGSFDYFTQQVGLGAYPDVEYLRLKSPFAYERSQLILPAMPYDPSHPQFTAGLIDVLPHWLADQGGSLILFSSYRQMNAVAEGLRAKGWNTILVQGEQSRTALLAAHKQRIDAGQASVLLGTGSFSEGLDLPGDYLTNLIITKLPFAVPTSPLEAANAEWVSTQGGNPFLQLAVPDASRRLIQACGRLIRTEQDQGRLVILDNRLRTKSYGAALLQGLPPFSLVTD